MILRIENLIYNDMIIDVWRPKFKGSGKDKKIIEYGIYSVDDFYKLPKGYIVRYICDQCKSGIETTTSSSLLNINNKHNTFIRQTCRSCRSRISEYEIKKTQIPFENILESFNESNYNLITSKFDYDSSFNKSKMKLLSICSGGHYYYCNWNNWIKGKRCRECYNINRRDEAIKYKRGYDLYYYMVWRETNLSYKKFKNIINPDNLKRGINEYHIDHIYSIYDGFKNNIPTYIISSVSNLRMIKSSKNISKGKKSDITIDELLESIKDLHYQ